MAPERALGVAFLLNNAGTVAGLPSEAGHATFAPTRMFSSILGAAAGNLALTLLTGGGVIITGGLCRGLRPLWDLEALTRAFIAKGRFSSYLDGMPIEQILRPHAGLLGAAAYAEPRSSV